MKDYKNCILLFFISCSFAPQLVVGKTLNVFTPELPSVANPRKANDIFSINLVLQLHKTLFKKDNFGNPRPDLVESFNVSNEGKKYKFKLKSSKFTNGAPLTSSIVKKSLEENIKLSTFRSGQLDSIHGVSEFKEGKANHIKGIIINSSNEFYIKLDRDNFKLLHALSDFRFSILFDSNKPEIGLGGYKLSKLNQEEVILSSFDKYKKFNEVVYKNNCNYKDKVENYIFPFGKVNGCLDKLKKVREISYLSYKNYIIHLNPNTIGNQDRIRLTKALDRNILLAKCYPGENIENNFVPRGFAGYDKNISFPQVSDVVPGELKKKTLKILIAKGVKSADCIAKYLKSSLSKLSRNVSVDIKKTDYVTNKWLANEADVIFWYLESEQDLDHISYFMPGGEFHFAPKDLELKHKKGDYRNIKDYMESMKLFSKSVLNSHSLIPLFVPKDTVYISGEIDLVRSLISSPTFINYDEI